MPCRAPLATAAAIIAGLALIALASTWAWSLTGRDPPPPMPYTAPVTACVLAASLYAVVESVRLLGGPGPFFCGGRMVVLDLLGLARAEPPGEIVEEGPYSVSRHPVYSATLAAYAGLALTLPQLAPGIVLVAAWVWLAAVLEERILSRSREYGGYKSRVPGLAPLRVTLWSCGRLLARLVNR